MLVDGPSYLTNELVYNILNIADITHERMSINAAIQNKYPFMAWKSLNLINLPHLRFNQ